MNKFIKNSKMFFLVPHAGYKAGDIAEKVYIPRVNIKHASI